MIKGEYYWAIFLSCGLQALEVFDNKTTLWKNIYNLWITLAIIVKKLYNKTMEIMKPYTKEKEWSMPWNMITFIQKL